jgi:hypothetical protein
MKLRVGEAGSCFTPCLVVARSATLTLEDCLVELGDFIKAASCRRIPLDRALLEDLHRHRRCYSR